MEATPQQRLAVVSRSGSRGRRAKLVDRKGAGPVGGAKLRLISGAIKEATFC